MIKWVIIGVAAVGIISLMYFSPMFFQKDYSGLTSAELDAELLLKNSESKVGLIFPKAALLMGSRGESGIDELVQIKIRTDQAGLEEFLQANRLARVDFKDAQRALLLPDEAWWDPSKPLTLPTTQVRRPDGPALNIGYTAMPGGPVDLYIMWFTT